MRGEINVTAGGRGRESSRRNPGAFRYPYEKKTLGARFHWDGLVNEVSKVQGVHEVHARGCTLCSHGERQQQELERAMKVHNERQSVATLHVPSVWRGLWTFTDDIQARL